MKRLIPALAAILMLLLSFLAAPSMAQTEDNDPIRPVIPDADRNNPDRVFLERADELKATPSTDYQILVGNVEFRREGMFMYCDSAHFYDKTGSFDAYGNVRMEQGDTLFVFADTLNYNDPDRMAILIAAPMKKVRLINRDVTLETDLFNYDLAEDLGYYEVGGTLTDRQNRLTSIEGEYSPTTKEAVFQQNVHLTSLSEKDTLEIFTDNLYYNTLTHIAEMHTDSRVINKDGIIYTTNGIYNTETTRSELFDRSIVETKNGNTLTGDTLYFNKNTGLGEAFGNIEINDTTDHLLLTGDYGFINELTDSAFVTGRARAIEYSSADSLFLHGDTIRTFRIINLLKKEIQSPIAPDSVLTQPGTFTDSTATALPEIPDSMALLRDNTYIPDSIMAAAPDSASRQPQAFRPVANKTDTIEIADTVRYIIAAPRVKFYRSDMQGLCDSMTFVSTDSMIYMNRHPVVWSENRQIFGDIITLHLNDSTVDWARLPQNGFMAEFIEDGYFNQLSGKEMFATFKERQLRHLDVTGNVLAITFPEENDSTINKMTSIETSFLAADFKDNALERMKLWSETSGTVTPLYLAKKSAMFLPDFKWFEIFRPSSPDDIFNFPPELISLFESAADAKPSRKTSASSQGIAPESASALPSQLPPPDEKPTGQPGTDDHSKIPETATIHDHENSDDTKDKEPDRVP